MCRRIFINPFYASVSFLYPLKISKEISPNVHLPVQHQNYATFLYPLNTSENRKDTTLNIFHTLL